MIYYSKDNLITKDEIKKLENLSNQLSPYYRKDERSYHYLTLNSQQKKIFLMKILKWFETTSDIKLRSYFEDLYDAYMIYYKPNDFFSKHRDNQYISNHNKIRKYVLGFHLNNDYIGGEYCLYENDSMQIINNEPGLVYAFESEIEHEIKPVSFGERRGIVLFIDKDKLMSTRHKELI
jgi:hypothetical protein